MSADKDSKPRFLSIVLSTLAAAIGVQKKSKLEQDFSQSSPLPFIIAGLVFTVLFISILALIVHFILRNAS